jgi:hypothetical protein
MHPIWGKNALSKRQCLMIQEAPIQKGDHGWTKNIALFWTPGLRRGYANHGTPLYPPRSEPDPAGCAGLTRIAINRVR